MQFFVHEIRTYGKLRCENARSRAGAGSGAATGGRGGAAAAAAAKRGDARTSENFNQTPTSKLRKLWAIAHVHVLGLWRVVLTSLRT